MKITIASLIVLMTASVVLAQTSKPSKEQVDELKQLRADVTLLRAQVKAQAAEIERLKAQLAQGGVTKTATQPATQASAPAYAYLGKPITPLQFSQLYKEFGKQMIVVDGNMMDIGGKMMDAGEGLAWDAFYGVDRSNPSHFVSNDPPPIGSTRAAMGVVLALDANSNSTFVNSSSYDLAFILWGLNQSRLTDSSKINFRCVVYVGRCKIGPLTMQVWVLPSFVNAPSEAQFAEALRSGFVLARWSIVKERTNYPEASSKPVNLTPSSSPGPRASPQPVK